jgi:hypothetical protein
METKTPLEQLESGRLSFGFTMRLARIAYTVSKRKLLHFCLPVVVLVAVILGGGKFLLDDGMSRYDAIGIAVGVFAFYSWFLTAFIWAPQAVAFLVMVEDMFGPKTMHGVLNEFLTGKVRSEGLNVMRTAKLVGEYEGSDYAKSPARQMPD